MELLIDKDFELLLDPLKSEEFDKLEASIVHDRYVRDAIVTWKGFIADGHNRYAICKKHDLPFVTHDLDIDSKEDVIEWIVSNQLGRRNINDDRWGYYQGKFYNNRKGKVGRPEKGDQHDPLNEGKVADQIAKETGSGSATVKRNGKRAEVADALQEAGLIDEAEKVKSSKQTTQAAVNEAHLALKKVRPGGGAPVPQEAAKEVAAIAAKPKAKATVSPGGGLVAPLPEPQVHPAAEVKLSKKLCPLCGFNLPEDRVAKLSVKKRVPQTDKERREDYRDYAVKDLRNAMFRVNELWIEIKSNQPSRKETIEKFMKVERMIADVQHALEDIPC
jgi:hypothetical protein